MVAHQIALNEVDEDDQSLETFWAEGCPLAVADMHRRGNSDDHRTGRGLPVIERKYRHQHIVSDRGKHHREIAWCDICMDEKQTYVLHCGTVMCVDCLLDIFKGSLKSGNEYPPRCCGTVIDLSWIRPHINDQLIKALKSREIEADTLDKTYCRRCEKFLLPSSVDTQGSLVCPSCGTATCYSCKSFFHTGPCKSDEGEKFVKHLATAKGWKSCPTCKQMVEKADGCSQIRCRCGTVWCYVCAKESSECLGCPVVDDPGQQGDQDRLTAQRQAHSETARQVLMQHSLVQNELKSRQRYQEQQHHMRRGVMLPEHAYPSRQMQQERHIEPVQASLGYQALQLSGYVSPLPFGQTLQVAAAPLHRFDHFGSTRSQGWPNDIALMGMPSPQTGTTNLHPSRPQNVSDQRLPAAMQHSLLRVPYFSSMQPELTPPMPPEPTRPLRAFAPPSPSPVHWQYRGRPFAPAIPSVYHVPTSSQLPSATATTNLAKEGNVRCHHQFSQLRSRPDQNCDQCGKEASHWAWQCRKCYQNLCGLCYLGS